MFQNRASSVRREENKAMKSFEGSFCNLNFSPFTSILLNLFFPFIDIRCVFLSSTSVLSYNRQEKRWLPKSTAPFPAKKKWHSLPPFGLSWDSPSPPAESVWTDGRAYVRTDGHVTITSQPKFFWSIGYQICLAIELRWRALPAGSATTYTASHVCTVLKHCILDKNSLSLS